MGERQKKRLKIQPHFFLRLRQPSKACEDYQDEDGRVLSLGLAENVVKRITEQPASSHRICG